MTRTLRLATLNIWHDRGPWPQRLRLIRQEIQRLRPDVIGLQEVLRDRRVTAGAIATSPDTCQAAAIAAGLGYAVAYGTADPGQRPRAEGNALLSRLPIKNQRVYALPGAETGEHRCALSTLIETPYGDLPVFVTHLNWKPNHGAIRLAQVRAIVDRVDQDAPPAGSTRAGPTLPAMLLGDFNAEPDSDEMRFLRGVHRAGEVRRGRSGATRKQASPGARCPHRTRASVARSSRGPFVRAPTYLTKSRRCPDLSSTSGSWTAPWRSPTTVRRTRSGPATACGSDYGARPGSAAWAADRSVTPSWSCCREEHHPTIHSGLSGLCEGARGHPRGRGRHRRLRRLPRPVRPAIGSRLVAGAGTRGGRRHPGHLGGSRAGRNHRYGQPRACRQAQRPAPRRGGEVAGPSRPSRPGLGRRLLATAEHAAAEAGITLLLLDTETASDAEHLYHAAGWTRYGIVPNYAAEPAGALRDCSFFYKALDPARSRSITRSA